MRFKCIRETTKYLWVRILFSARIRKCERALVQAYNESVFVNIGISWSTMLYFTLSLSALSNLSMSFKTALLWGPNCPNTSEETWRAFVKDSHELTRSYVIRMIKKMHNIENHVNIFQDQVYIKDLFHSLHWPSEMLDTFCSSHAQHCHQLLP